VDKSTGPSGANVTGWGSTSAPDRSPDIAGPRGRSRAGLDQWRQISGEPIAGLRGHRFQGPGLLEEVCGAWDDSQAVLAVRAACARRLSSSTTGSWPPTSSSVGARTAARREPAGPVGRRARRSHRSRPPAPPPRPVRRRHRCSLRNNQTGRPRPLPPPQPVRGREQALGHRSISKTLLLSASSSCERRSKSSVASPRPFSVVATNRLRGLWRLLRCRVRTARMPSRLRGR